MAILITYYRSKIYVNGTYWRTVEDLDEKKCIKFAKTCIFNSEYSNENCEIVTESYQKQIGDDDE